MKKRVLVLLLLLVCLAACYHGPRDPWPIDETHDYFRVPTGGKLGEVLVMVEFDPEAEVDRFFIADCYYNYMPLYERYEDIQEMEAEAWSMYHSSDVMDVNFDGYMDFCYQYSRGTGGSYSSVERDFYHYWVWDENEGQFVAVPSLSSVAPNEFDSQTETVRSYYNGCFGESEDIQRWEDGALVTVRSIQWNVWPDKVRARLVVNDRVDGKMVEVFALETTADKLEEERVKWYDLNYHDLTYHGEDD